MWFSVHNKKDRTEDGKNELTTSYAPESPETEFHVYGMEWTPDYIQAYIDGVPYYTFRNDGSGRAESWPFDKAFYLKLNIAVGGDWGGYEGIDDSIFPAEYVIDYVRVYQRILRANSAEPGATIRHTPDGSEPTETSDR